MLVDLASAKRVWAVIGVIPKKEDTTLARLEHEGLEAYCPKIQGRRTRKPGPLFPGYLFVRLSPVRELLRVHFLPGVRRPILFQQQLACLEEEQVERWRKREGGRGFLTPKTPPPFQPGQRVRFVEGVFSGLEAVVIETMPARERVRLLMQHLQGKLPIEVDQAVLR